MSQIDLDNRTNEIGFELNMSEMANVKSSSLPNKTDENLKSDNKKESVVCQGI